MDKPIRRTVGICVGHSLKTRPMEFYSPCEVEPYITYLEQRAEEAESRLDSCLITVARYAGPRTSERERAEKAEAQLADLAKQVYPKAVVRHYTGCKYPVIKINSLEVVIAGEREDAEELAEYVNSMRPAPAAVPVDLVPPMKDDSIPGKNDSYIDICDFVKRLPSRNAAPD